MVDSGVPISCAAPAACVPSATIRSLRKISSRTRTSISSRLRTACAICTTKYATTTALITKPSHMPIT